MDRTSALRHPVTGEFEGKTHKGTYWVAGKIPTVATGGVAKVSRWARWNSRNWQCSCCWSSSRRGRGRQGLGLDALERPVVTSQYRPLPAGDHRREIFSAVVRRRSGSWRAILNRAFMVAWQASGIPCMRMLNAKRPGFECSRKPGASGRMPSPG